MSARPSTRSMDSIKSVSTSLCWLVGVFSFGILSAHSRSSSLPAGRDRFPAGQGVKIWRTFADAFNCMPIAALVNQKIFCIHGGLSPELRTFQQIRALMRPTDIPETGLLCDLLWSDPKPDLQGWDSNDRGVSYTFGANVVKEFCDILQIDLVCRAHQVVEDGYEFFADQKLVTIFSAPNYTGEFDNRGAILTVTAELVCSLQILSPKEKPARAKQGKLLFHAVSALC